MAIKEVTCHQGHEIVTDDPSFGGMREPIGRIRAPGLASSALPGQQRHRRGRELPPLSAKAKH